MEKTMTELASNFLQGVNAAAEAAATMIAAAKATPAVRRLAIVAVPVAAMAMQACSGPVSPAHAAGNNTPSSTPVAQTSAAPVQVKSQVGDASGFARGATDQIVCEGPKATFVVTVGSVTGSVLLHNPCPANIKTRMPGEFDTYGAGVTDLNGTPVPYDPNKGTFPIWYCANGEGVLVVGTSAGKNDVTGITAQPSGVSCGDVNKALQSHSQFFSGDNDHLQGVLNG